MRNAALLLCNEGVGGKADHASVPILKQKQKEEGGSEVREKSQAPKERIVS